MDGSAFRGLGEAIVVMFWVGAGAVIGCIFLMVYVIWGWVTEPDWQREAISRGFATYCPHDGAFAWVGECEEAGQ